MKTFESISNPHISVGIVALNEEDYLPDMLSCIKAQDYPHHLIQVVLVDSGSEDATPRIMKDFATRATDFESVVLLHNPGKTVPKGWNVFLTAATGDVIVRVDAHARIPDNFLSQIIAVLREDEAVAGGPRPTITPNSATDWQRVLHTVEESMFGASIAKYRGKSKSDSNAPQYVKSVFHPGYRRSVIDKVGPFNEDLTRTEDNDYSYRIRKAGYKIRFDSRIYSEQIIRPSLFAMIRQKYNNGYWIGRTLFVQPGCIELYHLVPGAFVLAIAGGIALRLRGVKLPLRLLAASYGTADLALSAASLPKVDPPTSKAASLPLIFPALHIAYGIGTWKGIIEGLKETFRGNKKVNLDFLHDLKSKLQLRWHLYKNRQLVNREVTIISNNCIAGVIYHDCGLRFLSPTVNLWFSTEDFFSYAANILEYSPQRGAELREIFEEGISYPLGLLTPKSTDLPAIKLYFQHYPSFELAKEKWEQRSKRINLENICMIFECSQPIAENSPIPELFRAAPYSHKVIVTGKHSVTGTGTEVVHLPVYDLPGYQPGKLLPPKENYPYPGGLTILIMLSF